MFNFNKRVCFNCIKKTIKNCKKIDSYNYLITHLNDYYFFINFNYYRNDDIYLYNIRCPIDVDRTKLNEIINTIFKNKPIKSINNIDKNYESYLQQFIIYNNCKNYDYYFLNECINK